MALIAHFKNSYSFNYSSNVYQKNYWLFCNISIYFQNQYISCLEAYIINCITWINIYSCRLKVTLLEKSKFLPTLFPKNNFNSFFIKSDNIFITEFNCEWINAKNDWGGNVLKFWHFLEETQHFLSELQRMKPV